MPNEPLFTYLRTFRKRSGLSQEDVAFLAGSMCGTNVSRHEGGTRIPQLATVLAYAFIFETEVPALYEGRSEEIRAEIRKRARGLCRSLERKPRNAIRARKIALLKRLIEEEEQAA